MSQHWRITGYYGRIVSEQANDAQLEALDGVFDIYDVTDPFNPRKCTGDLGAVGVGYTLYWIANYGLFAHAYAITRRTPRTRVIVISL